MKHTYRSSRIARLLACYLWLATGIYTASGCISDDSSPDAAAGLRWYRTCGDPVCSGYTPQPGATLCTAEQMEGAACTQPNQMCKIPNDACNAGRMCTTSDPATMCPISQASWKRDIRYLTEAERQAATKEILDTRLATYHYRSEPDSAPRRLGFLIEDQGQSPAVLPSGERVDLYGYASMAVAAIQTQAKVIRTLEHEMDVLRAEIAELRRVQAQCVMPE